MPKLFTALLLMLPLVSTLAQQPAVSTQQPILTLRPTVREVLLDVIVTDGKGHPVKNLKPTDFTLLEDGVPQTFNHFEEHQAMTPDQVAKLNPANRLPPNTFTNYTPLANTNASTVILLDTIDTPIQAQMYIRQQVIKYMQTVQPGTQIAVFELDTSMHLIQGFTSDPQVLLEAVKGKRDEPKLSPLYDGHNVPYRQIRLDILTNGMQSLSRYLAGFPGRKNLIWFTGTVPRVYYNYGIGNPFPDSTSFIDDLQKTTDVLTLSRVAVYPIDGRGLLTDPAFSAEHRGLIPRNSGTVFATRQFYDHSDLDLVADATGGKAFYNTNGLKNVLAGIVEAGSNYYTIAYSPTDKDWHGQNRSIEVQLATPGMNLQYRHGYRAFSREKSEERHAANVQRHQAQGQTSGQFTPTAESPPPDTRTVLVSHPKPENLQVSMELGAIPPTELIFNVSVTPDASLKELAKNTPQPPDTYLRPAFQNKPTRDYKLLYAMDPRNVSLPKGPDGIRHGKVEFVAVAYTDQGQVVNSIISSTILNLSEASYHRVLQGTLALNQVIAIPAKGNYFLRVGVHDATSDKVGATEIPVDQVRVGIAGAGQSLTPVAP